MLSADDGFEATAKACHRAHAPRQIPVLKAGLALGKAYVGLQEHRYAAADEGAVRGAHDRHGQVGQLDEPEHLVIKDEARQAGE